MALPLRAAAMGRLVGTLEASGHILVRLRLLVGAEYDMSAGFSIVGRDD